MDRYWVCVYIPFRVVGISGCSIPKELIPTEEIQ